MIGKCHLGQRPQFHPLRRGFDELWGFLGGGHPYFPWSANGRPEPVVDCSFGPAGTIAYLTDDITDQSIAFVRRHREKPLFLHAAYNAPHAPLRARDEDVARFAFNKDKNRRTYCAMGARLDDQIGRLLARLGDWAVRLPHTVTLEGAIWKRRQLNLSDDRFPLNQPSGGDTPRIDSEKRHRLRVDTGERAARAGLNRRGPAACGRSIIDFFKPLPRKYSRGAPKDEVYSARAAHGMREFPYLRKLHVGRSRCAVCGSPPLSAFVEPVFPIMIGAALDCVVNDLDAHLQRA